MPPSTAYRVSRLLKKHNSVISHAIAAVLCAYFAFPLVTVLLSVAGIDAPNLYQFVYWTQFVALGALAIVVWWISRTREARLAALLAGVIGFLALAQQAIYVFVLLLIDQMVVAWVEGILGRPPPLLAFFGAPFIGMFIWPWVFVVLRDIRRKAMLD